MTVSEKIAKLYSKNNKLAYTALLDLMDENELNNQVYTYFEDFVEMMRNTSNSYIRTRGLRLLAAVSKWDEENKFKHIIKEYLAHMEDEKPITSRQCIKDTILIAKYKPELVQEILKALETVTHIYLDSMQSLVYKDRQKAIQIIKQYTW